MGQANIPTEVSLPDAPQQGEELAGLPSGPSAATAGDLGEVVQTDEPTAEPTTEPPPEPSAQPTATPPDESQTPVNIDATGGESLEEAWRQAYELPPGVPFSVTTTEAEVEAAILAGMAASGYGSNVSDLNVTLDDGLIGISFTYNLTQPVSRSVPASVVFAASIDSNGDLVLTATSASAGQFSIPPEMLTALNEAVSAALIGARSNMESDVTLTELAIDNGIMTVTGYVTPV